MLDKLKRNIILALIFAFVVFLALAFYSDFDSVISSLNKFNFELIPVLLLIIMFNLFFRFLKWHYYVRELNVRISFYDSLLIFSSGLVMSVTPGKWGEILKSFLIKHKTGKEVSETIPIVIAERITDIISLVLFALVGAYLLDFGTTIIYTIGFGYLSLIYIFLNRRFSKKIFAWIKNINFFSKHSNKIEHINKNLFQLFKLRVFSVSLFLSFIAWLFEFFGFYIILRSFTINISALLSSYIYSFATIVGSLSMLPGGLGATEGSLTFLLSNNGFEKEIAVVATLIIRLVTLWFAEFLGAIALLIFSKKEMLNITNINSSVD